MDLEEFRYSKAWKSVAGFVFTKAQLAFLRVGGFKLPEYEKGLVFYGEQE